ncbi:SMC-Scp complex subunit ScpB [Candidatus Poribacteria bacterium]|nr:SMC-Scp complex subunit ScpB [Candidatus Poribacteria bacterium]
MFDIDEKDETNIDSPDPLSEDEAIIAKDSTEQNTEIQKDETIPLSPVFGLKEIKNIIEALLLVSDKPLTIQKIKELIEIEDSKTIRGVISELKDEYDREERAFHILEVAGGYLIYTRDKFAPWIKKLIQSRSQKKLSPSLIETLAIIAYKQPISRLEIEAIRGVGASSAVKILMEKKLVRIAGKKEGVGKSLLYGTTKDFLIYFGLKSLEELPQLNELKEIMKGENPNQ